MPWMLYLTEGAPPKYPAHHTIKLFGIFCTFQFYYLILFCVYFKLLGLLNGRVTVFEMYSHVFVR